MVIVHSYVSLPEGNYNINHDFPILLLLHASQPGHRVTCRAQGRQFTTGHARCGGCIALVLALLNWLPQGLYGLFHGKSPTRMDEVWIIGVYPLAICYIAIENSHRNS